jgi:hypothetical protein
VSSGCWASGARSSNLRLLMVGDGGNIDDHPTLSPSSGAVLAIAAAPRWVQLKVPTRFTSRRRPSALICARAARSPTTAPANHDSRQPLTPSRLRQLGRGLTHSHGRPHRYPWAMTCLEERVDLVRSWGACDEQLHAFVVGVPASLRLHQSRWPRIQNANYDRFRTSQFQWMVSAAVPPMSLEEVPTDSTYLPGATVQAPFVQ